MIDELKSFVTVVNEEYLTRAADVLCVSQSAVSKRIQRLEEMLGAELFDRNFKPPKPTSLGNRVFEEAIPLLQNFERLVELSREDAPPSGTLRFGLPQVVADIAMFDAVMGTKTEFPSLDVRLHTDWSSGLHQMIESGALDAAVLMLTKRAPPPDELACRYVATLDVMVVQSRKKPVVTGSATINSLAGQDWILNPLGCGYRAALERAMDEAGRRLRLSVDTHGTEMQLRLISAGMGLGLVPKDVLARSQWKDELSVVKMRDFSLSLDVWLVSRNQMGNLKRAVKLLEDSVVESFRKHASALSEPGNH
ncbi:DNA-binding transcriptional LysR family regulator [Paraburkholderia sp. GAS199]|uniref:LysR family transcriptional regulator n=1 Tax=Paraburkholderia sp. GAS199 TaxID=3035126 RepID=UPI003D206A6C